MMETQQEQEQRIEDQMVFAALECSGGLDTEEQRQLFEAFMKGFQLACRIIVTECNLQIKINGKSSAPDTLGGSNPTA